MKTRSLVIVAVLAALLGAFGWYRWAERQAPAGQPPLATLDAASVDAVRSEFNAHADKVRLIVLLSPT